MPRFVSSDGRTVVDLITLSLTGSDRDGKWLRVTRDGWFHAEVRTCAELARIVDLADLRETLACLLSRRRRAGPEVPEHDAVGVPGVSWHRPARTDRVGPHRHCEPALIGLEVLTVGVPDLLHSVGHADGCVDGESSRYAGRLCGSVRELPCLATCLAALAAP